MRVERPLRVAYLVPDLATGGAERHVTTLMSHLDRARFDPMVVCLGQPGALFADLSIGDVRAAALGYTKRQALRCVVDLIRHLRAASPDVVVVRGYNAEVLGRVAAVLARVPRVVVWVHNSGDLEPRGVVRRVADRVLDRVTDAYFGVAKAQLPYLLDELRYPPSKVHIVHNGVQLSSFSSGTNPELRAELGIAEQDVVVGILAALRPEKDHETFLRAAAVVAGHWPTARFLVVGDGYRRQELEAMAEGLGIGGRVLFTGTRHDVAAVLAAMDVFVLSSFTIECFPMALLEAMASSLPAVCTAVGGIPEMLEDEVTGYLVPPRDPDALARRLLVLLRSEPLRRRFGEAAHARVAEKFSLERSVREAERQLAAVASPGVRSGAGQPLQLTLVLDETFVGGVELLMLEVFKRLDPEVVRPSLICLRSAGPLAEDFRAAGFPVEVLHRRGRFDLRTLPRLVRLLRAGRTDAVLVTHHHRAALALGRVAARLAGVRVDLVAVHDMDLTSVGQRCLPRWAVATLATSSALVLLSPSQGDYLHREEQVGRHRWSRTREVVIPNGVPSASKPDSSAQEEARTALGLRAEDFVIGIVARLSAQKAHQVLFDAFARLREELPDARLVVVGGGEREAELRELASRADLSGAVLFTGVRRDVAALLPAFDVACLSSVHEGVPMTVIESMAVGIPVVATDCGALRDMVVDGETGFLVPVGDSSALAERLLLLARNPDLRQGLGRSARERVLTSYRIEQTAQGYQDLLVDLVGGRAGDRGGRA